jgi:hypothetical protein
MPMNPRLLRPLARQAGALPPSFPTSNLLAFWKLADLTDSSGNGRTLTNTNSVAFVAGKIGNAAQFDGTNYLNRAMSVNFSAANTVSLWCRPDDVSGYQALLIGNAGNTINISYTGDSTFDINNASAGFINIAGAPEQWHHIVAVRDATTTSVWLNGVSAAQELNQSTGTASRIDIGASGGGIPFSGLIDAVGIWSRALSESEVALLYNGGVGREP